MPLADFPSGDASAKVGDKFVVSVKGRDADGYYLLSRQRIAQPKDWTSLEQAFAGRTTIVGTVTGVVKGGLSVDVGVRAFMPSDAIAWGLFGIVYGGIVGLAGNGGVLGLAEGAVVTGILWAIFGLVAGTLYGLWVGRSISARRSKPLRPLLPPDTSTAVCWAEGPLSDDSITEWSAPASDQLILKFKPMNGGAVLEV
jgi:hypothetical protein